MEVGSKWSQPGGGREAPMNLFLLEMNLVYDGRQVELFSTLLVEKQNKYAILKKTKQNKRVVRAVVRFSNHHSLGQDDESSNSSFPLQSCQFFSNLE